MSKRRGKKKDAEAENGNGVSMAAVTESIPPGKEDLRAQWDALRDEVRIARTTMVDADEFLGSGFWASTKHDLVVQCELKEKIALDWNRPVKDRDHACAERGAMIELIACVEAKKSNARMLEIRRKLEDFERANALMVSAWKNEGKDPLPVPTPEPEPEPLLYPSAPTDREIDQAVVAVITSIDTDRRNEIEEQILKGVEDSMIVEWLIANFRDDTQHPLSEIRIGFDIGDGTIRVQHGDSPVGVSVEPFGYMKRARELLTEHNTPAAEVIPIEVKEGADSPAPDADALPEEIVVRLIKNSCDDYFADAGPMTDMYIESVLAMRWPIQMERIPVKIRDRDCWLIRQCAEDTGPALWVGEGNTGGRVIIRDELIEYVRHVFKIRVPSVEAPQKVKRRRTAKDAVEATTT